MKEGVFTRLKLRVYEQKKVVKYLQRGILCCALMGGYMYFPCNIPSHV